MKIKLVGCAATMNEVKLLLEGSAIDCEFLDYSYHASPSKLHQKLQEVINKSQDYEKIIITYGQCSGVLVNLCSPRARLVIPNCHDCIGLLLGSQIRHFELLKGNPATYYFSQGWLDYGRSPLTEYHEYEHKYGSEKAKKLIKTLYGRYQRAVLIKSFSSNYNKEYRQKLKTIVEFFDWEVAEVEAEMTLLTALLKGLPSKDIICIEPGQVITEDVYRVMQ